MTYFCSSAQERLQQTFAENNIALSLKSDHIIAESSQAFSRKKIQEIVESADFCPLISEKKINKNFVFTVSPYEIPDFFNHKNLEKSDIVESNIQLLPIRLKISEEK